MVLMQACLVQIAIRVVIFREHLRLVRPAITILLIMRVYLGMVVLIVMALPVGVQQIITVRTPSP
jgi:hypothetical protein